MKTGLLMIGFTTVLIIVVLLPASYHCCPDGEGMATTDRDLNDFEMALEQYLKLGGTYPSNEQGLSALTTQPTTDPLPRRWGALYREIPRDLWGTAYRYQFPGNQNSDKPEIISAGPDRTFDTEDDLSNQD